MLKKATDAGLATLQGTQTRSSMPASWWQDTAGSTLHSDDLKSTFLAAFRQSTGSAWAQAGQGMGKGLSRPIIHTGMTPLPHSFFQI